MFGPSVELMFRLSLSINTTAARGRMLGGMKTNPRAWRVYQFRIWAGLAGLLFLVLLQFGRVFRFGRDCGGPTAQSGLVSEMPGLGDCVAGR